MSESQGKPAVLPVDGPEFSAAAAMFITGLNTGRRGFVLQALTAEIGRFGQKIEKHLAEIRRESLFAKDCPARFRRQLLTAVREHFSRVYPFALEMLRWVDTADVWEFLRELVERFQTLLREILTPLDASPGDERPYPGVKEMLIAVQGNITDLLTGLRDADATLEKMPVLAPVS